MPDPLTREQILSLSGDALDVAVAERVMGWHPRRPAGSIDLWVDSDGNYGAEEDSWHPSTSLVACGQVIEWIVANSRAEIFDCGRAVAHAWYARAYHNSPGGMNISATGSTLPEAVCRAAVLLAESKREA